MGEGRCAAESFVSQKEIFSVPIAGKFRYCAGKIPLLRSQNSVTAQSNFRYYGSKFPLLRKNNSFARPGPLPPGNVVPQRVAPSIAPRREIFPKKTAPPACGSGESSYLCTRFPEGGLARRRPRRSGEKKVPGCGKKVWRFRRKRLPLQPVSPWSGGAPGGTEVPVPGARRAIFEGIGSNTSKGSRERRVPPRVPRGLGRAPRERRQKSILQRRV